MIHEGVTLNPLLTMSPGWLWGVFAILAVSFEASAFKRSDYPMIATMFLSFEAVAFCRDMPWVLIFVGICAFACAIRPAFYQPLSWGWKHIYAIAYMAVGLFVMSFGTMTLVRMYGLPAFGELNFDMWRLTLIALIMLILTPVICKLHELQDTFRTNHKTRKQFKQIVSDVTISIEE